MSAKTEALVFLARTDRIVPRPAEDILDRARRCNPDLYRRLPLSVRETVAERQMARSLLR